MKAQSESRRSPSDGPVYVIRDAVAASAVCAACGREITGSGPAGYRDDDPVCDPCLFEGNPTLGLVLALVAVNRCYGALTRGRGEELWDALKEMGIFARVYESVAAKAGPARLFRVPGFTDRDSASPSD